MVFSVEKTFTPVKLSEDAEEYLQQNVITFEGLKTFNPANYEYKEFWEFVVMNYLTQKKIMIEQDTKKLQKEVMKYNESVSIARKFKIEKTLAGEPLHKIELHIEKKWR